MEQKFNEIKRELQLLAASEIARTLGPMFVQSRSLSTTSQLQGKHTFTTAKACYLSLYF